MTTLAQILIGDNDEARCNSLATLLEREGYPSGCAPDASVALEMLDGQEYDLLIAEITMPGNENLELIRKLPSVADGMQAILVASRPSPELAIQAIELPAVAAYLIRPFEDEELLSRVRGAIDRVGTRRAVSGVRRRMERLSLEAAVLERHMATSRSSPSSLTISAFLDLTVANIHASLMDLDGLSKQIGAGDAGSGVCHLFECPRVASLTEAIKHTTAVLGKTKTAFKSREIGDLRKRLEALISASVQPGEDLGQNAAEKR